MAYIVSFSMSTAEPTIDWTLAFRLRLIGAHGRGSSLPNSQELQRMVRYHQG
jgi:hypothetical protein